MEAAMNVCVCVCAPCGCTSMKEKETAEAAVVGSSCTFSTSVILYNSFSDPRSERHNSDPKLAANKPMGRQLGMPCHSIKIQKQFTAVRESNGLGTVICQ